MKLRLWWIFLLGLTIAVGVLTQFNLFPVVLHNSDNFFTESTDRPMEALTELAQYHSVPDPTSLVAIILPDSRIGISSSPYTPHLPIEISTDADLAAIAVSGAGTETDPYVLEGWNITTSGVHGISIHDTTKHFLIQNCWVQTGSVWGIGGIYLQNIAAGTATIRNSICQKNWKGIFLDHSERSIVVNNTCCLNLGSGITLEWSSSSMISYNSCYSNRGIGIIVDSYSWKSTVVTNICYDNSRGIRLGDSGRSIVSNNTCYKNSGAGIRIIQSRSSIIANNSCYKNEFGLNLHRSDSSTLTNNLCSNNFYGITLEVSGNLTVSNNYCGSNNITGLFLDFVGNSTVTHNSCSNNNNTGLVFQSSTLSRVTNNLFLENQGYGLDLDSQSANNQLYYNSFLANKGEAPQARDNGALNQWYEDATKEGNFWMDYMGQGGYQLAGTSNMTDPYPLGDVLDFDDDGMPNGWEYQWKLDPRVDDSLGDLDNDNLTNLQEYQFNTDPTNSDSDNDGLTDGKEVNFLNSDPTKKDTDNDFFPDKWDYGWWGNPRANWDNILTRGLFLSLLLGLGIWTGFIIYQLPKLRQDLQQQIKQLQLQADRLQESIQIYHTLTNLQELEEVAEQIHQLFVTCEQNIQATRQLIIQKWIRPFLRPYLSTLETLMSSITEKYEDFHQTRLSRVKEFMVDEGSLIISKDDDSMDHN